MKRRSFFKKLGISGLVASVAPQIIQEVKAEPEPFEIDEGVKVDYEIIPHTTRGEVTIYCRELNVIRDYSTMSNSQIWPNQEIITFGWEYDFEWHRDDQEVGEANEIKDYLYAAHVVMKQAEVNLMNEVFDTRAVSVSIKGLVTDFQISTNGVCRAKIYVTEELNHQV